ncbi:MAG: glycosyltransferase family 4 protein [Minisyncoccia bacterium]
MSEGTKKRVLIFSTAYFPFVGGAEVAVKEITDRLAGDFDFDLITARLDDRLKSYERIGSVNVYRLGSGRKFFDKLLLPFRGAGMVFKLKRKNKYLCFWAIMVSFASGSAYICNIVSSLVGSKKVPIVLNLQEGDSESHLKYRWGGLIGLSWWFALKQATFLTALSNFLLDRATKHGYAGRSLLVPNGVDLKVFSGKVPESVTQSLFRKFDKKKGDIFLITTSRLNYKNATDDIVSSLQYLPENISLLVLGIGEEASHLKRQAEHLGVASRVHFVGFVSQKDIPAYLAISDVFVRPSRSEGFGNSFIEAMAAGIPVVATPVGGIVDFLDDKETGVFCSPDNPKSISDAVMYYLNNESDRQRIVKNAKENAIKNYNWDKIAKLMKEMVFDNVSTI